MKNFAILFIISFCLSAVCITNANAAFPIKQMAAVQAQKSELVKTVKTIAQPSPKLVRPAHELEDIMSIAALVVGAFAVIVSFFTGFGLVLGILAIGLGIGALHMDGHRNFAHIGLLLGVAAVVIALIFAIVTF